MPRFTWTYRQFVGGNPALDLVNTVIYPDDATRRFDRLADATDVRRWTAAGVGLGKLPAELKGGRITEADRGRLTALRDAADRAFRPVAEAKPVPGEALAGLFAHAATRAARLRFAPGERGIAPALDRGRLAAGARLHAHVAYAALALAFSADLMRVKACPNCAWLFIDRSRNQRRRWCDMEVCGNRAKSRRYYERRRAADPAVAISRKRG